MDVALEKLCGGCLSVDRRVSALATLQPAFDLLMKDFICQNVSVPVRVCWECAARLTRVLQLQRSMQRAQILLLAAQNNKADFLISTSPLEKTPTKTYDFTSQEYVPDVDCKDETEVKVEIDWNHPTDVQNGDHRSESDEQAHAEFFDTNDDTLSPLKEDIKHETVDREISTSNTTKPATKKSKKVERAKRRADKSEKRRKKNAQAQIGAKNDWVCKDCGETFGTRGKMTYHRRTVHTEAVLCNECGRVFNFKPTLEKHMLTHFGGVPQYPCAICGKAFAGRAGVRSHMLHMHPTGAQEHYRCEPCDLTFKTKYKYRSHIKWSRRHGGIGTERHECDKCHRRYKTKQRLLEHYSYQHLGRAAHKCHICGKEISSLLGLRKHVRCVHEGCERPRTHVCETCGDAFKQPSMLRQHRYIHTGERPHACADCGATFRQKGSLYTHNKLVHLKLQRGAQRET